MPETTSNVINERTKQTQGRDYVHGDHAAIKRMLAVFAHDNSVSSCWHESGLKARLGGNGSVDNACPDTLKGDHAEAYLELYTDDGEHFRVNLACLLAALTNDALEAMEALRSVERAQKRDAA